MCRIRPSQWLGLFSKADTVADRNIDEVPEYVTGPASRACGACHRAHMINEDAAGELISFNQHTKTFGYRVERMTRRILFCGNCFLHHGNVLVGDVCEVGFGPSRLFIKFNIRINSD